MLMSARHGTAHASLAVLGLRLRRWDRFGPIRDEVRVAQKTVRHTPGEKLYDAFIALLAGAQGLVGRNRRLRADPALQAAFGRAACAEQSVVQDTPDACTAADVAQMEHRPWIASTARSVAATGTTTTAPGSPSMLT